MDKLFFCRISDRPTDILQYSRFDKARHMSYSITIFSVGDRLFTFTEEHGNICWISEIAKFDKETAKLYPTQTGRPAGHKLIRLKLVWKSQVDTSLSVIKDFINEVQP